MTTFNIGNQNAASIQNVGGDMAVHGGIHGTANLHVVELRGRLARLSEEIDRLELPVDIRAIAREALAEAAAEAAAPAPRSNRIAHSLRRVTDTLNKAGVFTNAAMGVISALASAVSLVPLIV
jgi:uncharacterized small protein (DUF1192 family)